MFFSPSSHEFGARRSDACELCSVSRYSIEHKKAVLARLREALFSPVVLSVLVHLKDVLHRRLFCFECDSRTRTQLLFEHTFFFFFPHPQRLFQFVAMSCAQGPSSKHDINHMVWNEKAFKKKKQHQRANRKTAVLLCSAVDDISVTLQRTRKTRPSSCTVYLLLPFLPDSQA